VNELPINVRSVADGLRARHEQRVTAAALEQARASRPADHEAAGMWDAGWEDAVALVSRASLTDLRQAASAARIGSTGEGFAELDELLETVSSPDARRGAIALLSASYQAILPLISDFAPRR
jgi:hypothetical protein